MVAVILYHYFAVWAGLNASVVALELETFVRIEDPTYPFRKSEDTGYQEICFFCGCQLCWSCQNG